MKFEVIFGDAAYALTKRLSNLIAPSRLLA